MHAPGNPAGAQTIQGDYVNRGTLRISGAPSALVRVDVAGNVDIAGSTLELLLSPQDAADWQPKNGPYVLIDNQSAGAVTGTFSNIRNPLLFLSAPVSTTGGTGNDVTLALVRNDRSMASFGASPNQAAVAGAIDRLAQGHEVWRTIALSNNVADLGSALAQLSGDTHANVASALTSTTMTPAAFNGLAAMRGNLSAPMIAGAPTAAVDRGEPPPAGALPRIDASPLWVQIGGDWRNLAGDGNASSLTQRSTNLTLGGDAAIGGGWRAGGAFGYTDARLSERSGSGNATIGSYTATVFGGKAYGLGAGKLKLMAGGAYSWHDIDSRRSVRYGSLNETLTAGYRGGTTQLFTEAGYALALSDLATIEPFVGVTWSQLRMQGFSESGGAAALSSEGLRQRNLSSLAGLRGSWQLPGYAIALRGMLGWRHVYGSTLPVASMAFDQGPAFSVTGTPIARDAARVEFGADLMTVRNLAAGLSYGGEFGGGTASTPERWTCAGGSETGCAAARRRGSDLCHAAVDEELDAIDEAGGIRGQKRHHLANLLRLAKTTQRHLCGQVIEQSLTGLVRDQAAQPRRADRPRAHDIHADAAVFQIQRPGARKVAHRRLAGAVDAEIRRAQDGNRRRRENHRGAIDQKRQGLLHREQGAAHVRAEDAIEMRFGDRAQRQHVAAAGIGKQDVEPAGAFGDLCVDAIKVAQHRGVGANARGCATETGHGGIEFRLAASGDEDARALCRQFLSGGQADARGAAGDQCDLAIELLIHDELQVLIRKVSVQPFTGLISV
ncbi:hypothetical protein DDE05_27940 [Streptomyces cavourensis]|nr:hypothetical protein DDE05_27940 [Streptomyces cavourensis]